MFNNYPVSTVGVWILVHLKLSKVDYNIAIKNQFLEFF